MGYNFYILFLLRNFALWNAKNKIFRKCASDCFKFYSLILYICNYELLFAFMGNN